MFNVIANTFETLTQVMLLSALARSGDASILSLLVLSVCFFIYLNQINSV